ncbi:MAG TPA: hypothetical protein VGG64_26660 [Pirellulales bacterium]|jgi:hypothetical protein
MVRRFVLVLATAAVLLVGMAPEPTNAQVVVYRRPYARAAYRRAYRPYYAPYYGPRAYRGYRYW